MAIIVIIVFFRKTKLWLLLTIPNWRRRSHSSGRVSFLGLIIKRKYFIVKIIRDIRFIPLTKFRIIRRKWDRAPLRKLFKLSRKFSRAGKSCLAINLKKHHLLRIRMWGFQHIFYKRKIHFFLLLKPTITIKYLWILQRTNKTIQN